MYTASPLWILGIDRKRILNSYLAKSRFPITYLAVAQSFWNFAQSTTVILPCSVKKTIGQLKLMLWTNEISWDLGLRCVSDGYPILHKAPGSHWGQAGSGEWTRSTIWNNVIWRRGIFSYFCQLPLLSFPIDIVLNLCLILPNSARLDINLKLQQFPYERIKWVFTSWRHPILLFTNHHRLDRSDVDVSMWTTVSKICFRCTYTHYKLPACNLAAMLMISSKFRTSGYWVESPLSITWLLRHTAQ